MSQEKLSSVYVYKDYETKNEGPESNAAYEKIHDEFFNKYGFTNEFKEYLAAKKRVMLKKLDCYLRDDRAGLNFVRIEEKEIEAKYETQSGESDHWAMVSSLEQALGFQINTKEMSVDRFYNHLRMQIEKNKQLAKWQRK
ncbi:MAG: hypothetical protein WBF67_00235 [Olleya sp.]